MAFLIDPYKSRSLTDTVLKIKPFESFVMNNFFKKNKRHSTRRIDYEVVSTKNSLARFSHNNQEAHLIKKNSKDIYTFSLPRTAEKKVFTAEELADYNAIFDTYGASPEQKAERANEYVLDELKELKDRVTRRREQMSCAMLSEGKLVIDEDDVKFTIDQLFTSAALNAGGNYFSLGADKRWSDTSVNPLMDIRKWRQAIQKRTGANASICILGEEAADAFINNVEVKDSLHTQNNKVGQLDLTNTPSASGIYLGRLMGVDFYEYNQVYVNSAGAEANFIPPKRAILTTAASANNAMHFGPIYRISANGKPNVIQTDMYVKSYIENEKILVWEVEQFSLPGLHNPEEVVSVQVVA